MEKRHACPTLWCLPDHLLLDIFSLVDLGDRAACLPLVCRRFRDLLAGGGAAWAEVEWSAALLLQASAQRCGEFLAWLRPRAGRLRRLSLVVERGNPLVSLPGEAVAAVQEVLAAAAGALERLRLVLPCALDLACRPVDMPRLAAVFVAAQRLHVGEHVAGMPALRQVELFTAEDSPPTFAQRCRLPHGITRLVLVPAPPSLPPCVLELQGLQYLDVGGGEWEEGALDAALPRFPALATLALDRGALSSVPQSLSCLAGLRVLSLHQALAGGDVDLSSFSVLSRLSGLTCLSISNCTLWHVPPGVMELTTLRALHTEGSLSVLGPGPYLRALRLLSVDWSVLQRDPGGLLRAMPCLLRLCVCVSNTAAGQPWEPPASGGAAEALGALAAHPTLRSVVLVVHEGEITVLSVPLVDFLVRLGRCREGLEVRVVPASAFFLTDGVGAGEGLW